MSGNIFPSDNQYQINSKPNQIDGLWLLILSLAALFLFTIDLGALPLRDWDEGIVAQVAREMGRGEDHWLYPVLGGGPYFNKPPLVHWLIYLTYSFFGVNEWTSRLPPAIITAFSVPLLYSLCRELFPRRTPTIFASFVYLTLLPVIRHGRLAMLDGVVITFFLAFLLFILRSRRDLRYALPAGISLGLLCLTKGVILGLLLSSIGILFLFWDTPRLLTYPYFWSALLLGSLPAPWWYGMQWQHYGQAFFDTNLFDQSWARVWHSVSGHQGPIWYYLLEIVKYSWPWLLFFPKGLRLSWENRNLSWGKLVLIWISIYLTAISVMTTKLPWYILPIYPVIAIVIGYFLAEIWEKGKLINNRSVKFIYPQNWLLVFGALTVLSWLALFMGAELLNFLKIQGEINLSCQLTVISIALTLTLTSLLIRQNDRQFILVLIWGLYLSLALFFHTNYWVWELGEDYPVKPVAAMIEEFIPSNQIVYTSHPRSRPSLNFYSDRIIKTAKPKALKEAWRVDPKPFLLIDRTTLNQLQLENWQLLSSVKDWLLITKWLPRN